MESYKKLEVDVWNQLAFVYDQYTAYIFINGSLYNKFNFSNKIRIITRTTNYIGRSNWAKDELADSYYKVLNNYNRGLNLTEIQYDMSLFTDLF